VVDHLSVGREPEADGVWQDNISGLREFIVAVIGRRSLSRRSGRPVNFLLVFSTHARRAVENVCVFSTRACQSLATYHPLRSHTINTRSKHGHSCVGNQSASSAIHLAQLKSTSCCKSTRSFVDCKLFGCPVTL
jgi:hypothetical protein